MAFLTILAIGTFGLLIAGVSHISISRERKALLEARARLAEEQAAKAGTKTKATSVREVSPAAMVQRAGVGRSLPGAPKQYRRVRAKL